MNFVVVTAALSSINTNIYLCSRMIFSLSRGGYAPRLLGKLSKLRRTGGGHSRFRRGHHGVGGALAN